MSARPRAEWRNPPPPPLPGGGHNRSSPRTKPCRCRPAVRRPPRNTAEGVRGATAPPPPDRLFSTEAPCWIRVWPPAVPSVVELPGPPPAPMVMARGMPGATASSPSYSPAPPPRRRRSQCRPCHSSGCSRSRLDANTPASAAADRADIHPAHIGRNLHRPRRRDLQSRIALSRLQVIAGGRGGIPCHPADAVSYTSPASAFGSWAMPLSRPRFAMRPRRRPRHPGTRVHAGPGRRPRVQQHRLQHAAGRCHGCVEHAGGGAAAEVQTRRHRLSGVPGVIALAQVAAVQVHARARQPHMGHVAAAGFVDVFRGGDLLPRCPVLAHQRARVRAVRISAR